MSRCPLCQASDVSELLDCATQPLSNRFLSRPDELEYAHRLVLGQCGACGLVQLTNAPVPAGELRPRYDWITYREPEEHLDQLADMLGRLPGLSGASRFFGVSFKDDSLLERMTQRGFPTVWRMDPERDLGIAGRGAGVETIQDRLDATRAAALIHGQGAADVLIARHILEHAHHLATFTEALKALVRPGGYLVLEVPDCTKLLDTCDYTMLWEEHRLYFTPETFRRYGLLNGFALRQFEVFRYTMENSLVAILQHGHEVVRSRPTDAVLREERARARAYAERFSSQRERIRRWLADYRRAKGKIALFGAGHLGCAFINLLGLRDSIECIVDDHPNKQGLFMPGSRLPIRGSSCLIDEQIRLCLLGLSPESEERVIQRNAQFLERGGAFASILSSSKRALNVP